MVMQQERQLHYGLIVRIYGDEKCFGPGIAQLLERVQITNSLRQAAASMNMAYSKAWRIVKTAEETLGFKLLTSVTGGKGGGGADLTEEALNFLQRFREFESAIRAYADEAFVEFFS